MVTYHAATEILFFLSGMKLVKAAVFLLVAAVGIQHLTRTLRKAASVKFKEPVIVELLADLGKFMMWFSAALITLSILGFSGIASSMGTAAGFVALGVSFALKDVISDTVAGIYLAQDPDFNSGDQVEVDGTKGEIEDIDLRKTRLRLENGDLKVLNNSDVEKKWTLLEE
jgi:small-conductance mechanosensitive channel